MPYYYIYFIFLLLLYLVARCFIFGQFLCDPVKSELAVVYDSAEFSICIPWTQLADKHRNYQISVPYAVEPKVYNVFFFGLLYIDTSTWHIYNTLNGKLENISKWAIVSAHTLRQLKWLLRIGHHKISLAILHSHQLEPAFNIPNRDNAEMTV